MEKIKVNLSYLTYSTIINDAEAFQIYKANGEINKNEIFNRIVANLSEVDFMNKIEKKNKYKELFSKSIDDEKVIKSLVEEIELINENNKVKRNDIYDQIVMIRPSKVYEDIFNKIIYNYLDNISISAYFRNLFDYYASLFQEERERIIFKRELENLNEALHNNLAIKLKLMNITTTFNIYKVVTSKEKLFNYVLGVMENDNNKRKTVSIHLNKVKDVILTSKESILYKNEIDMLKNMIEVGPQFIAGEFLDAKIGLTNLGLRKYRSIYLNRPIPYKKENNIFYFKCSRNQLFQYFCRFGKDAYVIKPNILREDLLKYYYSSYKNIADKISKTKLHHYTDVFIENDKYDTHMSCENKILHNCTDSSCLIFRIIDTFDARIDEEFISMEQNQFEIILPILTKHIPSFDLYDSSNPIKPQTFKLIVDDIREFINSNNDKHINRMLEAFIWYFEVHKKIYDLSSDIVGNIIININGL